MSDDVELRAAWIGACGSTEASLGALDELIARYREPHRRYHGVHHVVWVLRHIRELCAALPGAECPHDRAAVVAAAFFHDAVYDPTAGDNEDVSATLAERTLTELGWDLSRARAVAALVRMTASHHPQPEDRAAAVLADADLAVLGAEPAPYQAYVTGVRAEYAHVSDADWSIRRGAVLHDLAGRRPLYCTEPGRTWWDARARANLAAELASLSGGRA